MVATAMGPWIALLLLGVVHGMNPGMGWLFAVALGLQEGSGRAVWRALPPLVLGHAIAVAAALGLAVAAGLVLDPATLRWGVAALLAGTGVFHLLRHRHPRFGGMRVGARDLVIWSCLMASVHGAGLMALPFMPTAVAETAAVGAEAAESAAPRAHAHHGHTMVRAAGTPGGAGATGEAAGGAAGAEAAGWLALLAAVVHTAGYFVATGGIAAIVYYRFGLGLLRRAWVNMDRLWAGALIITAALVAVA